MEVKQGYKQTELGIIPKEWDVKSIDQIFSFYSTSNYSKAQMTLEGDVGCLHYGLIHAIKNSFYNVESGIKYYVNMKQAKYEFVVDGDIVMVDASEDLSGVNKSVEITGIGNKLYISGLHTYLLRDRGFLAEYFRGSILNSNIAKTQMLRLAVGMKVYGVSKPQIKTVLLPVPPFHEQTAIANALSDMDALISQTEKLIEKKKAIKQGAMQELLKPKEGWVTKKLGDYCQVITKGTTPTSIGKEFKDNGINFLKIESLAENGKIIPEKVAFIDQETHNVLKRSQIVKGDILFSIAGFLGRVAIVDEAIIPANTNQALAIIRLKKDAALDSDFLFFYLNHTSIQNHIHQISVQGAQANISLQNIFDFEIWAPKKEVQKSIASLLNDVNESIAFNISKLTKLKQQKQGMMQALLTGKIRLVS